MPLAVVEAAPETNDKSTIDRAPAPSRGRVVEYAADVTAALIAGWDAIQARNPEVPDAVISMATGGRESKSKLAHFAPNRWVPRDGGSALHELFVTAESLEEGAHEVFAVLVHEAAHGRNYAQGIKDCSASQYHNKHFRDAAELLGLRQRTDVSDLFRKKFGFAGTALTDETAALYGDQIAALDRAIRATRQRPTARVRTRGPGTGDGPQDTEGSQDTGQGEETGRMEKEERNYIKAVCSCPTPTVIRVSPRTLARRNIQCGDCKESFTKEG
ncbi:hypothetical protein ACWD26_29575 [Streptomyces sp. NPDC002787]